MKTKTKPVFLLLGLVLVIYVMRQNDLTLTKGLRGSIVRVLQGTGVRPSERLCAGISLEESFSKGDLDRAKGFMDNLRSQRGGNPLADLVGKGVELSGDDFVDYLMPLLKYTVPWAVFFVLSFLLCIGFYLNWCCMFGFCKNVKICKCCKVPKEPKRIKLCMGFTGFFLLGMLGASIAGTIFSTKISKGMEVTFCSALIAVENLAYGKPSQQWLGLTGVRDTLVDVQSKFLGVVNNLGGVSGSTGSLDTSYDATIDAIDDLYNDWNAAEIDQPNSINNPTDPKYKIEYVENLGPKEKENAYTYIMHEEVKAWRKTIDDAQSSIADAITSLDSSKNDIDTALLDGINTANSVIGDIEKVINDLDDNGKTVQDIFKGAGYGVMGVFIANLVLAIFAIASIVMVGMMKVKFFNKLLHLNWCIVIILTIFCWILATFFLPSSVVMLEACGVIDLSLNNRPYFEKALGQFFDGGSQKAKDIALTCLHGDGKALETLDLDDKIGYFDTIYDEIDKVKEYIPLDKGYSAATPPPAISIPLQQWYLDAVYNGLIPDSETTVTQLITLNQLVNSQTSSCTTAKDTWILNSANCTFSHGALFDISSVDTYDIPNPTCVGLDIWTRNGNLRYIPANYPDGCGTFDRTYVQNYVNGFVQHRTNVKNLIKDVNPNIKGSLDAVENAHRTFSSDIMSFVQEIIDIKDDLQDLEAGLVGEESGLIPNTNCQFIKTDLNNLSKSMCIGFVATLYQTAIVMIVTSFMAFISTIMVFCLAKKFSSPEKSDSKVNPNYLS